MSILREFFWCIRSYDCPVIGRKFPVGMDQLFARLTYVRNSAGITPVGEVRAPIEVIPN